MKVVIAIDSFKGCMTSSEAGYAAAEGVRRACGAEIAVFPLADGGEGTTDALIEALGGEFHHVNVRGPLGDETAAKYGVLGDGTVVMEMAEAAGIALLRRDELDPWRANTAGVGQMILSAAKSGYHDFIIGIGGSATTECGIGMLRELGFRFFDADGSLLPSEFKSLGRVASIDDGLVPEIIKKCRFDVACDVKNPLCGDSGAVAVFGPQKGVAPADIAAMDGDVRHFAKVAAAFAGRDFSESEGAGASGGLGFAFLSFFENTKLRPGISIILDAIGFSSALNGADVVITGEGRLDGQSAMGKVPVGVAKAAKKHGCKVLAFAGAVADGAEKCNAEGIDAFFPILRGITTLDEAMSPEVAKRNLSAAVEQVFRAIYNK